MEISIITGEKFQYLCDCYIGNGNLFQKNAHIYNDTLYEDKIVPIENIVDNKLLLNSRRIFIYTHSLFRNRKNKNIIEIFNTELKKKTEEFILVFHNSDDTLDESIFPLINNTKCVKIYGQNVNVHDKMIQYLPIGIANQKWKHGNKLLLKNIINKNIKKQNNIFFNFTINTNRAKRQPCLNALQNKIPFVRAYPNQQSYLEALASCKFCIVPDGNGFDSHRLWECLYLNTIPICIKNTFSEIISKEFPIYLINDWNELNIDDIYQHYDELIKYLNENKLDFSYWKQIIMNK